MDAIVHLAAKTSISDSFKEPYETFYTNIVGTLNVLEFAKIRKIRKFIYISTYVYGEPRHLPVDEKHVVNPHSPYNTSKLLAEKICEDYSNDLQMNIVTLRLSMYMVLILEIVRSFLLSSDRLKKMVKLNFLEIKLKETFFLLLILYI